MMRSQGGKASARDHCYRSVNPHEDRAWSCCYRIIAEFGGMAHIMQAITSSIDELCYSGVMVQ